MTGFDESRHSRDTAGKFAPHHGAPQEGELADDTAADETLLDGVPGADTWTDDDRRAVLDALGPGDELTGDEKQLLPVLLDPRNHEGWVESDASLPEILEAGRFAGYSAYDASDDENVADLLHEHYARTDPGRPYFEAGFPRSSEGTVDRYSTDVYCPRVAAYLSDHHDIRHLTRGGSGLRGALASAAIMNADWNHTLEKAKREGLLGELLPPESQQAGDEEGTADDPA